MIGRDTLAALIGKSGVINGKKQPHSAAGRLGIRSFRTDSARWLGVDR